MTSWIIAVDAWSLLTNQEAVLHTVLADFQLLLVMVSPLLILDQLGDGMLGYPIRVFLAFSLLMLFKNLFASLYIILIQLILSVFLTPILAIVVIVLVIIVIVIVVILLNIILVFAILIVAILIVSILIVAILIVLVLVLALILVLIIIRGVNDQICTGLSSFKEIRIINNLLN